MLNHVKTKEIYNKKLLKKKKKKPEKTKHLEPEI